MGRITHFLLDFDGVFTDDCVYLDSQGGEMVRCSRSDGVGIAKLQQSGVKVYVVSAEFSAASVPLITGRCFKLSIPLEHCWTSVPDKLAVAKLILGDVGFSCAAFMGNDIADREVMRAVGMAIAPSNAQKEIRDIAHHVTRARGGHGAVREACGWIMAKNQQVEKTHAGNTDRREGQSRADMER